MKTILGYLLRLTLACGLLAGLGFLYLKAYSLDPSQRELAASLLRDLKKIDAEWNADVLRAKNGQSKDYDAITAPQSSAVQVLDGIGALGLGRFDGRLADAQTVLRETITTKSDLVDRFKRETAIMRNSLRYAPAAAADFKAKAREAGEATAQKRAQMESLSAAVDRVLQDALALEKSADKEQARRLQITIGYLTVNRADYPAGVLDSFDVFARHVNQIAIQKERVLATLDDLSSVPLVEYTDALDKAAARAFDRAEGDHGMRRGIFFVYAALLAGLALFLALRAWRRRGSKPAARAGAGFQAATRA